MSITVSNLTKVYGVQKVVDSINFDAQPGKILGFLGPNGAGKTTTMKMLCCYTKPSSGTATVHGFDILNEPLQVRQQIGYLPENNPLYEEMYVKEYLMFVANIHNIGNSTKRISEVIDMTGLGIEQNKIIGTLSKGYRQRVGLAQAIIHDPKVLILDEPTSGLDMNQLHDIRSLISDLGKEKTVIFSSHIMQEVEALCDQVIIINQGKMVANENINTLRNRMRGSIDIIVECLEPNVSTTLFEQIPEVDSVKVDGKKMIITSKVDTDVRPQIFQVAVKSGITLLEMRREKANFEDVFRQLTQKEFYA